MGYLDNTGLQYLWGKLKEKFAPKSHSHDDRYYTESEMVTKLSAKAENIVLAHNANLNDITTPGFYSCGGGNSILNKPDGVDAIGLIVTHNSNGNYYTQILTTSSNVNTYRRTCLNETWSGWTQDKYTDTNTWRGIQNNLTSGSIEDSLSAAQGKILKELVDQKPDEMKFFPITIPNTGWEYDSLSYPYYIDIPIDGVKEDDCIAVTISPESSDIAKIALFTTTEARTNALRLRARNVPTASINAYYYFIREDIVKAFGFESLNVDPYVLPTASESTLGGIKIGTGLNIASDGTVSVPEQPKYELPIASATTLGGFKVGENLSISEDGVLTGPTILNFQYGTDKPTSLPEGTVYIQFDPA